MARIEKWDEVHGNQAPDERMMADVYKRQGEYGGVGYAKPGDRAGAGYVSAVRRQ